VKVGPAEERSRVLDAIGFAHRAVLPRV
jgi:hypothetical protein